MAADLHLVSNKRIHEARVYNMKHTNIEDKQWVCHQVKRGCRGSIYTNLDVDAVLIFAPHADDCAPGNDILYKMEKKNVLKRRAAEEMKTVPQMYHEEASSASADLQITGLFPTYKSVKTAMYRKQAQRFPRLQPSRQQLEIPSHWWITNSGHHLLLYNHLYNSILIFCTEENLNILSDHSVWSMDRTFKIVLEWYQQLFIIHVFIAGKLVLLVYCLTVQKDLPTYRENFDNLILKAAVLGPQTIICDFETALIPALQGTFLGAYIQGCYFHFCQAVLRKVTDLRMRTSYIHETATKKKVKMLLTMVSLPLHDVPAAVEMIGRGVTGSVAALINFFKEEWMTLNRLPLWNLLIYEQGSTETLNQQMTLGCVIANDLRIKNNKYKEMQLHITALIAEYDGGTHTME
ncbi:hypothetical protein T11_14911 [Trichinella zimbabwensis]|uniref:MULE transposase domain-containing protein n=1 Tax=Trichinella zimbabwensis TaxID=268475 RepID=A0A0V1HZ65_9BILA|nr:hypothetical protein T11_14911 [Trichinella zimbabwensis]